MNRQPTNQKTTSFQPSTTMKRIVTADRNIPFGWDLDYILAGPDEALDILDFTGTKDKGPFPTDISGIPIGNQDTPGLTFVLRSARMPRIKDSARPNGLRPPVGYSLTESRLAQKNHEFPFNHE